MPSGPSGALHTSDAWSLMCGSVRINFARNSLEATSNHELTSLQLQRLWTVSKSDRRKLCASFVQSWPCRYADTAARRFGHSGALHTGGAVSLMCGSVRRLGAHPGLAALQSCLANFACNSLFDISNFEFVSLELQRF